MVTPSEIKTDFCNSEVLEDMVMLKNEIKSIFMNAFHSRHSDPSSTPSTNFKFNGFCVTYFFNTLTSLNEKLIHSLSFEVVIEDLRYAIYSISVELHSTIKTHEDATPVGVRTILLKNQSKSLQDLRTELKSIISISKQLSSNIHSHKNELFEQLTP